MKIVQIHFGAMAEGTHYAILNPTESVFMNSKSRTSLVKIIVSSLMAVGTLAFVQCDDNDKNDNKSLLMVLGIVSQQPKIILYNAGTHNGALGGRSGADGICDASGNKPDGVTNVHAFISVSGTDQLIDMPANYGYSTHSAIFGPGGSLKIADNWAGLIGTTITLNMDLYDAGVLPTGSDQFLSGTNSNGSADVSPDDWTCSGWTSTSGTTDMGYSYITTFNWIAGASGACSETSNYLVCIAQK